MVRESPSWQLRVGTPASAIADDVFGYSGFEEHVARPVRRLEIGTPCPTLIMALGSEFRVSPISGRSPFTCQSLFVGPAASPVIVEHGGELRCVEVPLSPWATAAIFGPAQGWPGHATPLNEVWKRAGGELEESLAGLPSWAGRFEMLDQILSVKIPARCGPPSKLRWAWNEVSHLGGDARVNKLAASLGWSSRHFITKFQESVGLTPKAQARRWRFQKARTYLDQTSLSLAQVAGLCGYSDQSHLTREFRELGSCTPAAYRAVRFANLPGLPAEATEGQ
jgi:AraC-like DNA-binding protein